MNNLFSIFDPSSSMLTLNLNWMSWLSIIIFFPSSYWLMKSKMLNIFMLMFNYLKNEFSLSMMMTQTHGLAHFFVSIFLFIVLNNFLGLFPYIFTASSHLTFSVALALPMWVGFMLFSTIKNMNGFLTHLVPLGTPYLLMPFMVIIELISSIIRPLTLSVRLAANMIAGHLLMVLISSPISSLSWLLMLIIMIGLLLLLMLELAVSFIQSYVFSTLMSLYIVEVNSPNF